MMPYFWKYIRLNLDKFLAVSLDVWLKKKTTEGPCKYNLEHNLILKEHIFKKLIFNFLTKLTSSNALKNKPRYVS